MAPQSVLPWRIHRYATIDSTQDQALAEARALLFGGKDLPAYGHFSVHVANRQTHGRGQHARLWASPEGGLYLSAVMGGLAGGEMVKNLLPLAVGLAVVETIENLFRESQLGPSAGVAMVRWPNDILLQNKKVAGILSEGVALGSNNIAVIGIGLNVNTKTTDLSPTLQPYATSMVEHTGRQWDLDTITEMLLARLRGAWHDLTNPCAAEPVDATRRLLSELASRDALLGKMVTASVDEKRISGRGAGFAPNGALQLETERGIAKLLSATIISIDGQRVRHLL